jgi:hypothetical protein
MLILKLPGICQENDFMLEFGVNQARVAQVRLGSGLVVYTRTRYMIVRMNTGVSSES